MATWTAQEPEVTRNSDKNGLTLLKQHGTAIATGNTYDFGLKIVDSAWKGDTATDRGTTAHTNTQVAVLEDEAGTVAGTIYAWVTDA